MHGEQALAVANLPPLHRDPSDRLLVAQPRTEGLTLLTVDPDGSATEKASPGPDGAERCSVVAGS